VTTAPSGVQQLAWSPDSKTLGFATADEPARKDGYQRWNDSFEVLPNDNFLTTATLPPTHVWMVPAAGGEMKRLTSGNWTLPVSRPPGAPSSMITWTPDGSAIVFARNGGGGGGLQAVSIADGSMKGLNVIGSFPTYSPKGDMLAVQGGTTAAVSPNGLPTAAAGGSQPPAAGRGIAQMLDRGVQRTLWAADQKSLFVGGNDNERVSLWQAPLDGDTPVKLNTGDVSPNSSFFVDMAVSPKTGAIAFAGTSPTRPGELYYMATPTSAVRRLTSVNDEIASLPLGKSEVITFKNDDFDQNAILTYPPDFSPSKKYPLVLLIHGGPAAASLMTFSAGRAAHGGEGLARAAAELPRQRQPRPALPGRDRRRRGCGSGTRCHRRDQYREGQGHRR
jgi:dipeptidyl aminopeptidase/acylaminoacyl peptidase